jgi:ATP-dependent Clp protease ATP-binding subunit ClpA
MESMYEQFNESARRGPFERFNESARRALYFARQETSAFGSPVITPDHIVLGTLYEIDDTTRRTLEDLGIAVSSVRDAFPRPDKSVRLSAPAELPLSEDAKKVLAYAMHTAVSEGSQSVMPIHLLLGVLRLTESSAAKALGRLGLTFDRVMEAARPSIVAMAAREARSERTPLVLREFHYAWLDQLAANTALPTDDVRGGRQEVLLAVMDALAETSLAQQVFGSLYDLTNALKESLQTQWPKGV